MIQNNKNIENEKNPYKESNSVSMDLESLQKQYSNLLIKYKQSIADYMNYLKEEENFFYTKKQPFVSTKGQAFYGSGSAGQSTSQSLQECEASCANTPGCSGATFVSNENGNNTCALRSGDSQIIAASNNSYSIIPKAKKLLINIDNINQELISINEQILNKINSNKSLYDKNYFDLKEKSSELIANYNNLTNEREKILKTLNDYETLNNTQEEYDKKVTSNYYTFFLLFLLFIAILFLLYKIFSSNSSLSSIQYGGKINVNSNSYYIVFIAILLFYIVMRLNRLQNRKI